MSILQEAARGFSELKLTHEVVVRYQDPRSQRRRHSFLNLLSVFSVDKLSKIYSSYSHCFMGRAAMSGIKMYGGTNRLTKSRGKKSANVHHFHIRGRRIRYASLEDKKRKIQSWNYFRFYRRYRYYLQHL
jgi:hypothetical protein